MRAMENIPSFAHFLAFTLAICISLRSRISVSLEVRPRNFTLEEMFQRLVRDNPTVVLFDDPESDLEYRMRKSLETVDNAGSVVWTFDPWWKFLQPRITPWLGARMSTPFRWTFVCLIDDRRTRNRAEKYLEDLLAIGHGRVDRFMLIGLDKHISTFLSTTQVQRFQNILGVPTDKSFIYQRQIYNRPESGRTVFKLVHDLETVYWINTSTVNLNGQHFRISGTKFPPYLDWVYNEKGEKELMGTNYRILQEATQHYNYTNEFNPVETWKSTGKKFKNGTWDGIYGDLVYGETDIASVSTQTLERNGFADFVGPFGRTRLIFVTSLPENHFGRYIIFRSFSFKVWMLILSCFLIFVALIFTSLQVSSRKRTVAKRSNSNLLSKSLILLWALTLEQAQEKQPRGIRLLIIMWLAYMLVIGTGFKSQFAASISIPLAEQKPRTFRQLSEQTNYKVNFDLSGISAWIHFEESTNPIIKKIHGRSIQLENTTDCVLESFMQKSTVCIGWEFTLKVAAAKNLTIPQLQDSLMASADPVWTTWYTFALPRNSIFTSAFQKIGRAFFERGFMTFWRNRLLDSYRKDSLDWTNTQMKSELYKKLDNIRRSSISDTKPLRVEHFQFAFIILVTGVMGGLCVFCYEVCSRRDESFWRMYNVSGRLGKHDPDRLRGITVTHTKVVPINFVR